jgi:hypothetical protein
MCQNNEPTRAVIVAAQLLIHSPMQQHGEGRVVVSAAMMRALKEAYAWWLEAHRALPGPESEDEIEQRRRNVR